jgi:hypothetical protein
MEFNPPVINSQKLSFLTLKIGVSVGSGSKKEGKIGEKCPSVR